MSYFLVFNSVYRLEIQSGMLVFLTGFVNYCPFSLVSSPTLQHSPLWIRILYTHIQCVRGGGVWGHRRGRGLRQINNLPRKVPLQVNFVRWWHLALYMYSVYSGGGEYGTIGEEGASDRLDTFRRSILLEDDIWHCFLFILRCRSTLWWWRLRRRRRRSWRASTVSWPRNRTRNVSLKYRSVKKPSDWSRVSDPY